LNTLYAQSIYRSDETGNFQDAEAVALDLNNDLKGGDRVVAVTPSDAPLRYYFMKHGISQAYLYQDINQADRLWIVVNEIHEQTLVELLNEYAPTHMKWEEPVLVKRYKSSVLYEVRRT